MHSVKSMNLFSKNYRVLVHQVNSIPPRAVTDFMAQMIQPKIGEQMADIAVMRLIQRAIA